MIDVTPLILTFNERENIGRTLAALSWAEQIVIIDSFSTDETIAIAKAATRTKHSRNADLIRMRRSGSSVWPKSERRESSRSMWTTNFPAS